MSAASSANRALSLYRAFLREARKLPSAGGASRREYVQRKAAQFIGWNQHDSQEFLIFGVRRVDSIPHVVVNCLGGRFACFPLGKINSNRSSHVPARADGIEQPASREEFIDTFIVRNAGGCYQAFPASRVYA